MSKASTASVKSRLAASPNWGKLVMEYYNQSKGTVSTGTLQTNGTNAVTSNWVGWGNQSTPLSDGTVLPQGWNYLPPQPLTSPYDQEHDINFLLPTPEIPFRQIKLELPYGNEIGVLWFDGEPLPDALERLAAEIRGFIPF